MQQFTVPQFIDVEDKIIGPVTTRQFVIMLSGSIGAVICYRLFSFGLFLISTVLILGFCAVFAFIRVNGRPFHLFVLNIIQTLKRSKVRVWNQETFAVREKDFEARDNIIKSAPAAPRLFTRSRLNELSLVVDTRGFYKGEGADSETSIQELKL